MSGHEDNLIDTSENEDSAPKIDILEWGNVWTGQPLQPVVLNQSFTARPAQTLPGHLEPASDSSKTAHASGSLQSLPSLDSNLSSNCPSQSYSWPRAKPERRSRTSALRSRPSLKQSSDGDDKSISSLPTKTSDDNLSTYSNQSSLHSDSDISADLSDPVEMANPYMKRIIWVMASVAFVVVGAGVALVLHSVLQSSGTQPVIEEAQPSDPHEVMDLDLDMGTS